MKVLVFGAGGKTGGLVVDQCLARGHEVTVLVRDASRFSRAGARVLTGDATKSSDVASAMHGQEAVIDTIGGSTPYKTTQLETTVVRNAIAAMEAEGARRLIVVSMMGLGASQAQAPIWYKYLLMPTFLRGSTKDKAAMEAAVIASGLEWVIARPPILKDDDATGGVTVLKAGETGHAITRADLAKFLVDQLADDRYVGQAPTVVNS
jgi:putative NADH-flavin reductase